MRLLRYAAAAIFAAAPLHAQTTTVTATLPNYAGGTFSAQADFQSSVTGSIAGDGTISASLASSTRWVFVINPPSGSAYRAYSTPVNIQAAASQNITNQLVNAAPPPVTPPATAAVSSFNNRSGAVTPTTNDYSAAQISGFAAAAAAAAPVTSVANRTGAVTLTSSDIGNFAAAAAAAAPVTSVAGRTGAVVIAAGDVSGLGSAATQPTGTSGATVPLLNGVNTWGSPQTFAGSLGNIFTVANGNELNFSRANLNYIGTTATGGAMCMRYDAMIVGACLSSAGFGVGSATTVTSDPFYVTLQGVVRAAQIAGSGSAPTAAAGTAAGTTPGTPTVTGTNLSGVLTLASGTSPASSGTFLTVTFSGTLSPVPQGCQLTPRNSATAAAALVYYTTAPSSTTWTIATGSTAPAPSTTYSWSYICM